jgi:hypothetical protein
VRSETPEEPFTLALLGTVAFDHVDLFEDLPAAAEDPARLSRLRLLAGGVAGRRGAGLAPAPRLHRLRIGRCGGDHPRPFQRRRAPGGPRRALRRPLPEVAPAGRSDPAAAETDLDDAAYGAVVRG